MSDELVIPEVTPPARIPFREAKYFKAIQHARAVDLVVLHSAEVGETLDGAEALMTYCAANDRVASWHYAVDADSVTQSVLENDVAYHAPGANGRGIGIELCGRARQTTEEWMDDFSIRTLELAAWLTAGICIRRRIPADPVDVAGLLAGKRGITTHDAVSKAWKKSTHTDPGPHFPMDHFISRVRWWIGVSANATA